MKKPTRFEDTFKGTTKETYQPRDEKVTPIRPPPAYRIEAVNAGEIEAPKPSEYLIKGIIEPSQVSIWYGPPGNGKTFLLLHLAYAIARGDGVFGRRVRQADTLYCALEGRGGIDKRIHAMAKEFGPAPRFWRMAHGLELLETERGGTRINVEHVEAMTAYVREKNIKLVIIDTLNLTIGGADENDNSAMGLLVRAANDISSATGAHIAFVAHSAKRGIEGGPRGGGAQKGNADLVVSVSGDVVLTASTFAGSGGKIKDGEPFNLHFKLKPVDLLTDDDGDVMTSCTVEESEEPSQSSGRKLTRSTQGWWDDLASIFAEGLAQEREIFPGHVMLTLTRAQVREGFRRKGRLGDVSMTESIESKYRTQLRTQLNALKDYGKVALTDELVGFINGA